MSYCMWQQPQVSLPAITNNNSMSVRQRHGKIQRRLESVTESSATLDEERGDFELEMFLDNDPHIDTTFPGCFRVSALGNLLSCVCFPITFLMCCGFVIVPEKSHVCVLYFGKYKGSIQEPGIHWLPPIGAQMQTLSTATRTWIWMTLKSWIVKEIQWSCQR